MTDEQLQDFQWTDSFNGFIYKMVAERDEARALLGRLQEFVDHSEECAEQMFESAMDICRWKGTKYKTLQGVPIELPKPPEPECTCGLSVLLAEASSLTSPHLGPESREEEVSSGR